MATLTSPLAGPVVLSTSPVRSRWRPGRLGAALTLAGLLALGWLGLRLPPAPFPEKATAGPIPTVPLPQGLPVPVERFYRLTYGDNVPVITSAIISGRGRLRFLPAGPFFPARFRFIHEAGKNYRHYIEVTWFGLPFARVNERYLDGVSRMLLPAPLPSSEGDPRNAQAANLGLWAESIWLPALYLTDPRVTWTGLDDHTALLSVPFEQTRETFKVSFDPATGRLSTLESMRYRDGGGEEKLLWLNEIHGWGELGGAVLPTRTSVTWMDQGRPWAHFTAESVVYNADVQADVRRTGP